MKIRQSERIAIFTRYYGPTNQRDARIKAYTCNRHALWMAYSIAEKCGGSLGDNSPHDTAAIALCDKYGWEGDLVAAHTNDGAVYLFEPTGE
jgi:hypothetical protein